MKPKKLINGQDWCVTGINKLSKVREVLTVALPKSVADDICHKEAKKKPKDRSYLRLKVEKRENYHPYSLTLF